MLRMQENPIVTRAWGELFQTERSAERHSNVEADRLGDGPPAAALRAVSAHATRALGSLEVLARARNHEAAASGRAVGDFFSGMRRKLADLTLTQEVSYRGTLLGMRHGIDLVTLVHHASSSDTELHAWTASWLEHRQPLVDAVARELQWFAAHPDAAEKPIVDNVFGGVAKQLAP